MKIGFLWQLLVVSLFCNVSFGMESPAEKEPEPIVSEFAVSGVCFWDLQFAFDATEGVHSTSAGYLDAPGTNDTPVCVDGLCCLKSNHVESLRVKASTPFLSLLKIWFNVCRLRFVSPSDEGVQYGLGIYVTTQEQMDEAKLFLERVRSLLPGEMPLVELKWMGNFRDAVDENQRYWERTCDTPVRFKAAVESGYMLWDPSVSISQSPLGAPMSQ